MNVPKVNPCIKVRGPFGTKGGLPRHFYIDDTTDQVVIAPCCQEKGIIIESHVPRALLRRYLRGRPTPEWENGLDCVFSSFHAFETAIRTGQFDAKGVSTTIFSGSVPPFGFPPDFLFKIATLTPKRLADDYSIFLAVYLRIYYGYWLMHTVSPVEASDPASASASAEAEAKAKAREIVFAAQLFCDTHIDLANAMISNEAFTNAQLCDPLFSDLIMDDLCVDIYTKNYPHDVRFHYSGDLPNLIPLIDAGGMWYHMPIKASRINIILATVHILSSKTQPFRCQGRNNMLILTKKNGYFAKFPDIQKLYGMFLRTSLLGNYGFAAMRPCFEARLEVYRFFSDCVTEEERVAWMSEYDSLIKCIAREYAFYLFKSSVLLDLVYLSPFCVSRPECAEQSEGPAVSYIPNTGETRGSAFLLSVELCNHMRKILSDCAIKEGEDANPFEFYINTSQALVLHQSYMEPFISKIPKHEFARLMKLMCTKIYKTAVADPSSTVLLDLREKVGAATYSAIQICLAQFFIAEQKPLGFVFPLYWFKVFGLSTSAHKKLQEILHAYLFLNTADHPIERKLTEIAFPPISSPDAPNPPISPISQKRGNRGNGNGNAMRDFFIIYTAFELYAEFEEEVVIPLSERTALRQESALRAKYRIQPWEDTPLAVRLFYYCSNCKKWANDVITQPTFKNAILSHSIGGFSCRHDTITDKITCGNEFGATSIRVLKSNGTYEKVHVDNPDTASLILRHRKSALCTETEMRKIDMIGIAKKLGKYYYALCELCASLCIYTTAAFSSVGFTCQCHAFDSEWFRPVAQAQVQVQTQEKEGTGEVCFFCKNERKRNDPLREIRLYDDMETHTLRHLFVCKRDYIKMARVMDPTIIQRKSVAFNTIQEQREKNNELQKRKPRRA